MKEIRRSIDLPAGIERVWAFLTEQDKIATWLMDSDLIPEPGSRFRFTAPAAGRWDGVVHCEVRDVIDRERISYTWEANDIGVVTLVTFDLEPTAEGTRLTLVHQGLEGAMGGAHGRHAAGWTNCLKALRRKLAGGQQPYDWSGFQITCYVDAPRPEVYRLWSTSDGMLQFWGDEVSAVDEQGALRPGDAEYENGDRVRIRFPTHTLTSLEILNIERNHFILFSFGEDYGWVSVFLEEDGNRTRVILKQFGLPVGDALSFHVQANARGWWIANLMNIQSVLLHGKDLRVRTPGYTSGLGTLFSPGGEKPADIHDWTAFDIYLHFDAAPEPVMRAWCTASGLASFFIREVNISDANGRNVARDRIRAGDHYHWRWIHDYELSGQFISVEDDSVSFTFGSYRVDVSAQQTDQGTLLHLHQSGIQDIESDRIQGSLNCRCCWIYFMVNLKSLLEHGYDLRDSNPRTADAVSVGYNLTP